MSVTIGIISGSGPEAGLDLCDKVLRANRDALGPRYRGDLDAPRIVMISEPRLGLSMDLAANKSEVWAQLRATAKQLANQVDLYAIACNTLNVFGEALRQDGLPAELVTVADAVSASLSSRGIDRVGLLGALPVAELGDTSAYQELTTSFELVVPDQLQTVHDLVQDIKLAGRPTPELTKRLDTIASELGVSPVLLACTELPLVHVATPRYEAIDVTELLADELVRRAIAAPPPIN